MAVKCLSDMDKADIAYAFRNKTYSIGELVTMYDRSRRTIIRVLEENNIDPGIKARAPKQLKLPFVIPTKTPWYRRILGAVGLRLQ